jgi:hypothetical protein
MLLLFLSWADFSCYLCNTTRVSARDEALPLLGGQVMFVAVDIIGASQRRFISYRISVFRRDYLSRKTF